MTDASVAPSPEDITRSLVVPLEGKELRIGDYTFTVWEANTYQPKPGELHLEIGATSCDTYDVVLQVRSIRPHGQAVDGAWRVGHCQPQNLYEGDRYAGSMLTGRTAQRIAHAFTGGFFTAGTWTREGRHLFEDGIDVGSMFTEDDATQVVAVMNGGVT